MWCAADFGSFFFYMFEEPFSMFLCLIKHSSTFITFSNLLFEFSSSYFYFLALITTARNLRGTTPVYE